MATSVLSVTPPPLPVDSPLVAIKDQRIRDSDQRALNGYISLPWVDYLTSRDIVVAATAQRVASAAVTAQSATIAATSLPIPANSTGVFQLNAFLEITTAATTSSSLQLQVTFTHFTLTKNLTAAAMTGNTNTTVQSSTFNMVIDPSTPITYTILYISVGATPMQYAATIWLSGIGL